MLIDVLVAGSSPSPANPRRGHIPDYTRCGAGSRAVSGSLRCLRSPLRPLGRIVELFGVDLSHRVDITAHRLVPGQRIRMHNDYIPGAETHRLLMQFNRGWQDDDGGLFLLFNSADPADIHKIFRPVHNSAIGFAITAASYHAVSTIHAGERFTLVYSFYEQPSHE